MKLGIDFGTSLSSAALWRDGRLLLVKEPLRLGYSFPTSVYLMPSGEILVGQAAERQRLNDPGRYRREFKRVLGEPDPILLGDRSFPPEDLAAAVLRKLNREAENLAGGPGKLTGAVITVPAAYKAHKRGLMERAARAAGFGEIVLLEEPIAAALTYTQEAGAVPEGAVILVYDLGGGTFDAALLRRTGPTYESIAVPLGLEQCGGIDFDQAIYRDVRARFPAVAEMIAPSRRDRDAQRLRAALADFCRDIKHLLSEAEEAELPLPMGFPDETYALSRAAFTAMIAPHLDKSLALCRQIVQSANLKLDDIAGVLMVGGSCRMPPIQAAVASLGRPVWRVEEPELAVCQGAALHARLISPTASPAPGPGQATPEIVQPTLVPEQPKHSAISPASRPTPPTGTRLVPAPNADQDQTGVATNLSDVAVSARGPGHCRTIGEALRRAAPGATIRVEPGCYAESLVLDQQVTLISADPAAPVVLTGPDAPALALRAEGTTVRGFRIACAASAGVGVPLVALSARRLTLENCELRPGARDGFAARGVECEATLRRCRIADAGFRGGTVEAGARVTLEECQIAGSAGVNLHVAEAGAVATLLRCEVSGGQGDGVKLEAGAEATLDECLVYANAGAGVRVEMGSRATLRHGVVQANHTGLIVGAGGTLDKGGTTILLNADRESEVAPGGVLRDESPSGIDRKMPSPSPTPVSLAGPTLDLVGTLAFSPDGRWLAGGDRTGQFLLWDVEQRQVVRSFVLPSGRERTKAGGVSAATFAPGVALLASGHSDPLVRLWDAASGRLLQSLPGHRATVRAVAISRDGNYLTSGGDDQAILVWWLPTRGPLGSLQGHTDAVTSLAPGPHEPLLASGSKDRTVRLWDLREGALKFTMVGHEDAVRAVCFDPTGATIASASADCTVRLWETATSRPLHTLRAHQDAVYALAFAGNGLLVSGGWDQRIILWDTATGAIVREWSAGPDQWIAALAASPAAPQIASAGAGGGVKLWEM